jgi:hypothetical protein
VDGWGEWVDVGREQSTTICVYVVAVVGRVDDWVCFEARMLQSPLSPPPTTATDPHIYII